VCSGVAVGSSGNFRWGHVKILASSTCSSVGAIQGLWGYYFRVVTPEVVISIRIIRLRLSRLTRVRVVRSIKNCPLIRVKVDSDQTKVVKVRCRGGY
jgi:hypothetical protein